MHHGGYAGKQEGGVVEREEVWWRGRRCGGEGGGVVEREEVWWRGRRCGGEGGGVAKQRYGENLESNVVREAEKNGREGGGDVGRRHIYFVIFSHRNKTGTRSCKVWWITWTWT